MGRTRRWPGCKARRSRTWRWPSCTPSSLCRSINCASARRDLEPLALSSLADAEVLAIVGQHDGELTLNLKAPLVINVPCRLGRQVITESDAAVHHVIVHQATVSRTLAWTDPALIPATTGLKRVA